MNKIANGYLIMLNFKYLYKISKITLACPVAIKVILVLKPFSFKIFLNMCVSLFDNLLDHRDI